MSDCTPARRRGARQYPKTSRTWPCIFSSALATERLGPAIKTLWEKHRSDRPKWGDLRTIFRREHCKTINPYGSESCPFAEWECALAFHNGLRVTLESSPRNPYGFFMSVVRRSAAERADLGVEKRAAAARMRTPSHEDEEPFEG